MATITLKYNSRNQLAQKTIDYILSLGVFDISLKRKNPFEESDEDIAQGRVYEAKDADDLIRQCSQPD